jgi:dienelactone hydrolase
MKRAARCGCRVVHQSSSVFHLALVTSLLVLTERGAAVDFGDPLAGTSLLTGDTDYATEMVEGIDRFLSRLTDESVAKRGALWQRDFSSHEAYLRSIEPNRERFRRIIGATNPRQGFGQPVGFWIEASPSDRNETAEQAYSFCRIEWVRWPVHYTGGGWSTEGEGLLLTPSDGKPVADIIALPDADTKPSAFVPTGRPGAGAGIPLRLVKSGCRVLVPMLIDRNDEHSLVAGERRTNQPHREFLYRQAYELGTHIIGYEVEKVQSAVECLRADVEQGTSPRPIGVFGYGEGGLIGFYAAAVEPRIDAVCISGYFDSRQQLWSEPIYRNVWALLTEFGDAEIASLIAPRPLIIEFAEVPRVDGPPRPADGKRGAAPGRLTTPTLARVVQEVARAQRLVDALAGTPAIEVVSSGEGNGPPGRETTLTKLLAHLCDRPLAAMPEWLCVTHAGEDRERHFRQFQQLVDYTQHLLRECERRRREFWADADRSTLEAWQASTERYREYFGREVIGRIGEARRPPAARSRQIFDEPKFRGYEVVLDVLPDVPAYGILLVPKQGTAHRRPVVVCQHGLEGRPRDVADPQIDHPAYHRYACRLAELGFVTFAPQNPYIGHDKFRTLQRKANPLKLSLFSLIVEQHQAIVDWLAEQAFVDPDRIGFYGLSYGGKTAMRVPALVNRYCLSICSADFNEWIWKNASVASRYSYLGTDEYEMVEFDLGNTFNYAEMAALIAPRPFMVERGHHDGVAPDEWVAYEYAKVRKIYSDLGVGQRTRIEFFDGPHTIHGVGTFDFLEQHLR